VRWKVEKMAANKKLSILGVPNFGKHIRRMLAACSMTDAGELKAQAKLQRL